MISQITKFFSKRKKVEKDSNNVIKEDWYIVRPYKNNVPIKLFKFSGNFSKYYLDLTEKNGYCYIMNFDNKSPMIFTSVFESKINN